MSSDDLDISLVWKSLVASCVCVYVCGETRVHLQCPKCLSPDQHKTRSSLAINAFVCSVISYLEVSSRGYLVASNKCVCMQCDIVLGGE